MDTYSEKNQRRIELIARNFLIKHKALEWGVTPNYLIKKEGLDIGEYNLQEPSFIKKLAKRVITTAKRIKAAIFPQEGLVLIDQELHPKQKVFGASHELGHHCIPEHRAIFYVCSEHDLNPDTRRELEFEANVFASEILFPEPLLGVIYREYPLSMETVLHLARLAKASIYSAAIKYVRASKAECCLLVLNEGVDDQNKAGLLLNRQILSPPWWEKYRRLIKARQFFYPDHNLCQTAFEKNSGAIAKTTVRVKDLTFNVHVLNTQYSVLALVFK